MRRALTLLAALALVTGCGSDEGSDAFIRVTFDGATWSGRAGDAQLAYTVDNPDDSGMYVSIASTTLGQTSRLFSLGLPTALTPGSYALDERGTHAAYLSCPNETLADCAWWGAVAAHPGTLTITDVDPETEVVRGTFSFNGYFLGDSTASAKSFTGGAFAIHVPGMMLPLTSRSSR